jgi:hypothetical protein
MPYIDPVTGAYVEDSLAALPPGYNQPKAGNEANVAKMRAALNSEEALRQAQAAQELKSQYAPDFINNIKLAMQHMPGAGLVQGVMPTILAPFQLAGSAAYGAGNQIVNPQTANFNKDTAKAMQALQYNPPTQVGRDISEGIAKIGEATGPLPELWTSQRGRGFSPDDLRVAGKTAVSDVRNFPMDYANAREGLTRDYPTLGSRAAEFVDLGANVARPLAEKAYDMYMNPQSSVEVSGLKPGANLTGLFDMGSPMYAVKPKGGNWPTNLGSTNRLSEQGEFGIHLADAQISDPAAKWFEHLPRQIRWDWERYIDKLAAEHGNLTAPQKQAYAEEFTKQANTVREERGQPLITLPSAYEAVAPQYNSWVMGPYQKYIANQMGTGLSSDPLVQAFNETNLSPDEFSTIVGAPDYRIEGDVGRSENRRRDFVKEITRYGRNNARLEEPQNVDIGKQTATSPAGIAIENALDAALYPKGTYAFNPENGYPYANKLPNDTIIHDFITHSLDETTALPSIQKKVLEDLIAGNLDVNKLSNLTPAVVARQMIKDELAKQKALQANKSAAESYRIARNKELPADMEFPDGSKMVVFTKMDYDADPIMLTRDLSQITKDLHQCIGAGCHGTDEYPRHGPVLEPHTGKPPKGSKGTFNHSSYFNGLQRGDREIASLKDPQGVSQFTANLTVRGGDYLGSYNTRQNFIENWVNTNGTPQLQQKFLSEVKDEGPYFQKIFLDSVPELKQLFSEHFLPKSEKNVTEMKGYDNGEIKPEYIPYVKEWLNKEAPNLNRVDMDKLEGEIFDLQNAHSANNLLSDKHQNWSSVAIEELLIDARDNNLLSRFFDDKEFEALAQQKGIDLTEDPAYNDVAVTPDGQLTEAEQTRRQEAYERASQELRDTFTDTYLQDAFNRRDNSAIRGIVRELEEHPALYGLGDDSPGTRQAVINRLRNQGLHTPNEQLEQPQFNRLTDLQASVLDDNIENYFADNGNHLFPEDMVEPYATDTRILMGDLTNPEARLPTEAHRRLVDRLLSQDDHTQDIRDAINHLQTRGAEGTGLSEAQAENALNILISWTERYPLNE